MRLRRALARAAAVLLAVPAALALSTPAQADPIEVDGCYGVAVVVCDPAIDVVLPVGLEPWSTTIPVCAGTCTDVPVDAYTVGTNDEPRVCVKTEDRNGNESRSCVPLGTGGLPEYFVGTCPNGESGLYVYDSNGNTVVNACFYVGSYSVERCGTGYAGAYVYDEWGNQVAGRCVRIGRIPTIEELCAAVNDALAQVTTGELNCNIAQ